MKEVKEELVVEKKTYHSPTLANFGNVAEMTQGGVNSSMSDHGMDMMFTS